MVDVLKAESLQNRFNKNAMVTEIKNKYVIDDKGNAVSVLVDVKSYRKMLADLEELELIRAWDAPKVSGKKSVKFEKTLSGTRKSDSLVSDII